MAIYSFVQLNARPGSDNPTFDYGIEITAPHLLSGQPNLDHHGQDATVHTPSAAEQALTAPLPAEGSVLAILRPDGDSITALAVLTSRATGRKVNRAIVTAVGKVDRLGPKAQTRYKKAPMAIGRVAADYKIPLEKRVEFVQSVLDGSVELCEIKRLVKERAAEHAAAVAASTVSTVADSKIAVVVSEHRFATDIGYKIADVIVATNPKMRATEMKDGKPVPTDRTYIKHTVGMVTEFAAFDIAGALAELSALEPGWGGLPTVKGSPQNVDSQLTTEQVIEVVKKYLK